MKTKKSIALFNFTIFLHFKIVFRVRISLNCEECYIMNSKIKTVAVAFASLLLLASCNPTDSENNSETTKTVVNVYMPSPAGLQTKIEKGFEKAYPNIDMNVTSGTTGELLAKIEAEKNNPICDVLILASWSDGLNSLNSLELEAYEPVNSDKLDSRFKEDSKKIWGTSASSVGVLYNTDNVKKEEIEKLDWSDFGNADKLTAITSSGEKAKVIIPDPTKSGAAKDFFAGLLTSTNKNANFTDSNDAVYDLIRSYKNAGVTNGGGNKPALASVEDGQKDVLIAGVDYNAYADSAKGKHVGIYFPKGGTVVNARPAMIMKSSKNKDSAKKVMDYLVSEEAQKFVADAYLLPGRTDVPANSARVSLKDSKEISELDWNLMSTKGSEIATSIVNLLK